MMIRFNRTRSQVDRERGKKLEERATRKTNTTQKQGREREKKKKNRDGERNCTAARIELKTTGLRRHLWMTFFYIYMVLCTLLSNSNKITPFRGTFLFILCVKKEKSRFPLFSLSLSVWLAGCPGTREKDQVRDGPPLILCIALSHLLLILTSFFFLFLFTFFILF